MELYTTAPNWLDEGVLPRDSMMYLTPESAWDYAQNQNWKDPVLYKVNIPEEHVKRLRTPEDVFRSTCRWDDIVPQPYEDPRRSQNYDRGEKVRDRTRPPMPVTNNREKDPMDRFTSRNPYSPSSPATVRTEPQITIRGPNSLNLQDMVSRFASKMRARTRTR